MLLNVSELMGVYILCLIYTNDTQVSLNKRSLDNCIAVRMDKV